MEDRQAGLGWLRRLPFRVDDERVRAFAFSRLGDLAATHDLSVYDAASTWSSHQRRALPLGMQGRGVAEGSREGRRRALEVTAGPSEIRKERSCGSIRAAASRERSGSTGPCRPTRNHTAATLEA
jgi:hypothetical protein